VAGIRTIQEHAERSVDRIGGVAMTRLELEYRTWRQTPESKIVLASYRRLAKAAADRGRVFDIRRLALGGVQVEFSRTAELGAPKCKVYNEFLSYIRQDLVREMPELEPFVKSPARRPGGRNARASGATR
jgi:hypothetical protein